MPNAGLPDWLGDIHDFIAELRDSEFRIGIAEEVRVVQVVDFLRNMEDPPQTVDAIAQWLAPVLCTTGRQQGLLRDHLQHWASAHGDPAASAESRPAAPSALPAPSAPVRIVHRAAGLDRWLVNSGVLAFVVLVAFVLFQIGSANAPDTESIPKTPQGTATAPAPAQQSPIAYSRLFAGALPLAALFAFVAWRRGRPEALARRFKAPSLPSHLVGFAAAKRMLFVDRDLSHHFQALRKHVDVPSETLDVQRTLRATIRSGGRVELRYGTRRRLPDYLLLIDRMSVNDMLCSLAEVVTRRFTEELVPFTSYEFHGDPRRARLRAAGTTAARVSELADLSAVHGNHPILLFTDAQHFFRPVGNQPQPWVAQLLEWPLALIFTPKPRGEWAERERCLSAMGFILMPITSTGIMAFANLLRGGTHDSGPSSDAAGLHRLWQTLEARPDRWLRSAEPESDDLEDLKKLLRDALGDVAFGVLCASAVFPAINAEVTLWLADQLKHETGAPFDEASFCQLARLPWLRRGSMPDWLRTALIDQMGPERQAEVRRLCVQLLEPVDQPGKSFQLEIVRDDQPMWVATLLAALRRDDDSPLHDRLFLGFLRNDGSRSRSRSLALDAPTALSHMLRPKFAKAEVGAAVVALLAAALAWSFHAQLADTAVAFGRLISDSRIGAAVRDNAFLVRFTGLGAMLGAVGSWHVLALWRIESGSGIPQYAIRAVAAVAVALAALLLIATPSNQGAMLVTSLISLGLSLVGTRRPREESVPDRLPLLRNDAWYFTAFALAIAIYGLIAAAVGIRALSDALVTDESLRWVIDLLALEPGILVKFALTFVPLLAIAAARLPLGRVALTMMIGGAGMAAVFVSGITLFASVFVGASFYSINAGAEQLVALHLLPLAVLWGAAIVLWRVGKASLDWLRRTTGAMLAGSVVTALAWRGFPLNFADMAVVMSLLAFAALAWPEKWGPRVLIRVLGGATLLCAPLFIRLTGTYESAEPIFWVASAYFLVWPAFRLARPELWEQRRDVLKAPGQWPIWIAWAGMPLLWLLCVSYDFGIIRLSLSYLCLPLAALYADKFGRRGLAPFLAGTFWFALNYANGPISIGANLGILLASLVTIRLVTDPDYWRGCLQAGSLGRRQWACLLLVATLSVQSQSINGMSLSIYIHSYLVLLFLLIGLSAGRFGPLPLLLVAALALGLLLRLTRPDATSILLSYGVRDPSVLMSCLVALYGPRFMRMLNSIRTSSTARTRGVGPLEAKRGLELPDPELPVRSSRWLAGSLILLPQLLLGLGFVLSYGNVYLAITGVLPTSQWFGFFTEPGLLVIALLIGWFVPRRALLFSVVTLMVACLLAFGIGGDVGGFGTTVALRYSFRIPDMVQGALVTMVFVRFGTVLARRVRMDAVHDVATPTGRLPFPPLDFVHFDRIASSLLGAALLLQLGSQLFDRMVK